jgi:hypothetical protein
MEKSLIIYGKNPGIVSAITIGVMNLIKPFIWEGIFLPLVPDVARELFGAPVPLVAGTTSPPRLVDISPATAVLHLNDDSVQTKLEVEVTPCSNHTKCFDEFLSSRQADNSTSSDVCIPSLSTSRITIPYSTANPLDHQADVEAMQHDTPSSSSNLSCQISIKVKEVEFLAWFVRLPEVSADMPVPEEMSKRINHLRKLMAKYLLPKLHLVYDIFLHDSSLSKEITASLTTLLSSSSKTDQSNSTFSHSQSTVLRKLHQFQQQQQQQQAQPPQTPVVPPVLFSKILDRNIMLKNITDHNLLYNLPELLLKQISVLLIRIKQYNYQFCGNFLSENYDWKRFLKRNAITQEEEFYPTLFLEPLRNQLEFQDAIFHTQMFVSFMDRLRKESQMLNQVR